LVKARMAVPKGGVVDFDHTGGESAGSTTKVTLFTISAKAGFKTRVYTLIIASDENGTVYLAGKAVSRFYARVPLVIDWGLDKAPAYEADAKVEFIQDVAGSIVGSAFYYYE